MPLQSPTSLAVRDDGEIVLLDAAFSVPNFPNGSDIHRAYQEWFGDDIQSGQATPDQASIHHSRALLKYFQTLAETMKSPVPEVQGQIQKVHRSFRTILGGVPLETMQSNVQQIAEVDFGIEIDDSFPPPPPDTPPVAVLSSNPSGGTLAAVAVPPPVTKKPSRKGWLVPLVSILLNLLLIAIIIWLLMNGGQLIPGLGGDPDEETKANESLRFASYCVVFPTQGTTKSSLAKTLEDIFPKRLMDPRKSGKGQATLLQEKKEEVVQDLSDAKSLQQLLNTLKREHSISFKGHNSDEPDGGLKKIIERGSIFTISAASEKKEFGSLLQYNGAERILEHAKLLNDKKSKRLIEDLRKATVEFASFKDALTIIGNRSAFLIQVDPTPEAHEKLRKTLLARGETPVFIPRPVLELFDAVDPSKDEGEGYAKFVLKLETKCYWRLGGEDDQVGIDKDENLTNHRLLWTEFAPGLEIAWSPVGVLYRNGRAKSISSFDIAVVVNENKVVVFRNQNIFLGDTRDQVNSLAKNNITKFLKLNPPALEDFYTTKSLKDQYTSYLVYTLLADQVTSETKSPEIELYNLDEFLKLRAKEDTVLSP